MENDLTELAKDEIVQQLKRLPEGWQYLESDKVISKEFEFINFLESLSFLNQLAPYCEEIEHHPNIYITYSRIKFDLQRFDAGGIVTSRDFSLAKIIEKLYKQIKKGT